MEGTIGEIRMFAGNFAPTAWALCDGQLLPISQNEALFSILGTTYGGDGQETFALPNFQSRTTNGTGQGAGLSNTQLGQIGGAESVTLQAGNFPAHTHPIGANSGFGSVGSPSGNVSSMARDGNQIPLILYQATANAAMPPTGVTGSSSPIPTPPPYVGMNYIICLFGIFPSAN